MSSAPELTTHSVASENDVERASKVLFAVTANQINKDPNGYDQLPEKSKEDVRRCVRAVAAALRPDVVSPSPLDVERVARALYGVAQDEARKIEPNAPLPSYDDDDEDSRRFCRSMAEAAIAALSRPVGDERLRSLLDHTPTGGLKLPRWKAMLRADAAVLATEGKTLTPEYRKGLVERLGTYQQFIDAALSGSNVPIRAERDGGVAELQADFEELKHWVATSLCRKEAGSNGVSG